MMRGDADDYLRMLAEIRDAALAYFERHDRERYEEWFGDTVGMPSAVVMMLRQYFADLDHAEMVNDPTMYKKGLFDLERDE